jgi:hypothetical protein
MSISVVVVAPGLFLKTAVWIPSLLAILIVREGVPEVGINLKYAKE